MAFVYMLRWGLLAKAAVEPGEVVIDVTVRCRGPEPPASSVTSGLCPGKALPV